MQIKKTKVNDTTLVMAISEKIDVTNAQGLYNNVISELDGIQDLTIDFAGITFVSSAGLRTILDIGKAMKQRNIEYRIINTPESLMDIFKMTGFDKILSLK